MSETELEKLRRWELNGALWRVRSIADGEARIDLCTCHGEPVDEVRSDDPELLAYLADRPSSEHPPDQV